MKHNPIIKALTLILVFCIADVYVLAEAKNTSARDETGSAPTKLLLGRLVVPNHQEILVNGHSAMSGDTIISGARLQTPSAVIPAMVDIGSIAKLYIKPNTDLMVTFDTKNVEVRLSAGDAALSTRNEVKGQVIMRDGKTYKRTSNVDTLVQGNALFGVDDAVWIALGVGVASGIVANYIYGWLTKPDCPSQRIDNNASPVAITIIVNCTGSNNTIYVNK